MGRSQAGRLQALPLAPLVALQMRPSHRRGEHPCCHPPVFHLLYRPLALTWQVLLFRWWPRLAGEVTRSETPQCRLDRQPWAHQTPAAEPRCSAPVGSRPAECRLAGCQRWLARAPMVLVLRRAWRFCPEAQRVPLPAAKPTVQGQLGLVR